MHSKSLRLVMLACAGLGVFVTGAARANGYKLLCLRSTKATAMGEAFIAQADDPSALAFNPAGLSQVRGMQLSLEGTLCNAFTEHTPPGGGASTDIEDQWQFVPAFYATHDLGREDLAVGFGVSMPNGLSSEWDQGSFARYAATYSDLTVADVTLGVGMQVTDTLRLGVGLDFYYSHVQFDRMVYTGGPDLKNEIEGNGTAWGANFGLIYDVHPQHSVAVTYRLPYSIDYDGDFRLTGFPTSDMDLTLDFPAVVVLGYAYKPTDRLTVEVNLDWTHWDSVDKTRLEVAGNPGASQDLVWDYENAMAYKIGLQYQYTEALALRCGYIYNERAVPDRTWNPSLPETDMHFFTAGFGYDFSEALTVNAAVQLVYYRKRTVNNATGVTPATPTGVSGAYRTWAPCVSAGVTYRF